MMMEEEKRGLDLKFPRPSLSLVVLALCWGAQHCGDTLVLTGFVLAVRVVLGEDSRLLAALETLRLLSRRKRG